MTYLTIDIGNTRIHYGVFSHTGDLLHRGYVITLLQLPDAVADYNIDKAIVSSVRLNHTDVFPIACEVLYLSHTTPLPFTNAYTTPETLGKDRIAGMAGAVKFFPGKGVLVFDAGTCITIDVMSPDGVYTGGNIAPGMHMRFQAMHDYTDGLPLVSEADFKEDAGTSTRTAMAAGVVKGMVHEMEGYIQTFEKIYPQLQVILCGGDSIYFEKQLKSKIFALPELVLHGLYHILRYND